MMSELSRTIIKESIINSSWWLKALRCIDPAQFNPNDILYLSLGPQERETLGKWPEHLANYFIDLAIQEPGFRERIYSLIESHENEDRVMEWLAALSLKLANISEPYQPWLEKCWESMKEIQNRMLNKESGGKWEGHTWEAIHNFLIENNWPEDMVGFVWIISEIETIEAIDFLRDMYTDAPKFGSWQRSIQQQLEIICRNKRKSKSVQKRACQVVEEIMKIENEEA